mgnify:CR=1 FL=1
MKQRTKTIILNILGIFFIGFGLLAIIQAIKTENPSGIFWLCYAAMILIGIGALRKDSFLIASQINLLFIPLLFWVFDFIYILFTGNSLFGLAEYFFTGNFLKLSRIISTEHLFLLPLGFLALYLIKLKRKDFWKVSVLQIVLFYLVTLALTDPEKNINCVFESCFAFIGNSFYGLVWFFLFISMTAITNIILLWVRFLWER